METLRRNNSTTNIGNMTSRILTTLALMATPCLGCGNTTAPAAGAELEFDSENSPETIADVDAGVPDTSVSDVQDTAVDIVLVDIAIDVSETASADVVLVDSDSSDTCGDSHVPGDNKVKKNACWQPPFAYCAQIKSWTQTLGCNPASDECCLFATSCIPCGWSDCSASPWLDECGLAGTSSDCALFLPDLTGTICWDDAVADPNADTVDGEGACSDPHTLGDGKVVDKGCWNPPSDYCASGASQVITKGCDPLSELCCSFKDSCLPCGWVDCFNNPAHAACSLAMADSAACSDAVPDTSVTICW